MNQLTAKPNFGVLSGLVMLFALLVGSCTSSETNKPDPNARIIDIYSATIESVASHMGTPVEPTDKPKLIFINNQSDSSISAEVQLGVVLSLEDWATIRFIDDLEEAIDASQPSSPPKNEGMLIGLGNISSGETATRIYADAYLSDQETWVFDVALRFRGGEWQLEHPLEPTLIKGASH